MQQPFSADLVVWKRKFLGNTHFQSAEELVADAVNGGPAAPYAAHLLALREKSSNRKTMEDLRAAVQDQGSSSHWLKRFQSAGWILYVTEKAREAGLHPGGHHEQPHRLGSP